MDDYEVGYRKPPVHSRFQPGQSGNPRGRPRKSQEDDATMWEALENLLGEPVSVRQGDKVTRISTLEALLRALRKEALSGNMQALKTFLQMIEKLTPVNYPSKIPQFVIIQPENCPAPPPIVGRDDAGLVEAEYECVS